jgi:hypothetical protein
MVQIRDLGRARRSRSNQSRGDQQASGEHESVRDDDPVNTA